MAREIQGILSTVVSPETGESWQLSYGVLEGALGESTLAGPGYKVHVRRVTSTGTPVDPAQIPDKSNLLKLGFTEEFSGLAAPPSDGSAAGSLPAQWVLALDPYQARPEDDPQYVPVSGTTDPTASASEVTLQGYYLEGVVGARLAYERNSGLFHLWYMVYGWTSKTRSNTLGPNNTAHPGAVLTYSMSDATTFDPKNWFVSPDPTLTAVDLPQAELVLLHAMVRIRRIDAANDYLVLDESPEQVMTLAPAPVRTVSLGVTTELISLKSGDTLRSGHVQLQQVTYAGGYTLRYWNPPFPATFPTGPVMAYSNVTANIPTATPVIVQRMDGVWVIIGKLC